MRELFGTFHLPVNVPARFGTEIFGKLRGFIRRFTGQDGTGLGTLRSC
jgi:hypothetical protein